MLDTIFETGTIFDRLDSWDNMLLDFCFKDSMFYLSTFSQTTKKNLIETLYIQLLKYVPKTRNHEIINPITDNVNREFVYPNPIIRIINLLIKSPFLDQRVIRINI